MVKKPALYVATVFLLAVVVLSLVPYFLYILNGWYLLVIIPVDLITLYAIFHSHLDIKNVGKAASLIRIALALDLTAFAAGVLL